MTTIDHVSSGRTIMGLGAGWDCTGFVIEFFGRDTRGPTQLFADEVLPALRP